MEKFEPIVFVIDGKRVHQAANNTSKVDLSSERGEQFIDMFRGELENALHDAFRAVVKRHFGEPR